MAVSVVPSMKPYDVDFFIRKFTRIPTSKLGRESLKDHCALFHCGVRCEKYQMYRPTVQSKALILLMGGRNEEDWSAVWSVNDDPAHDPKTNMLNALYKIKKRLERKKRKPNGRKRS